MCDAAHDARFKPVNNDSKEEFFKINKELVAEFIARPLKSSKFSYNSRLLLTFLLPLDRVRNARKYLRFKDGGPVLNARKIKRCRIMQLGDVLNTNDGENLGARKLI